MKRTLTFGRAKPNSNSNSNSSPKKKPNGYNAFRAAYIKKLTGGNNSNSNNGKLNYAGVNYNVPYFIMPNGMIISRHSMYGAVRQNYGQPKRNRNTNIVAWVKAQQANNSRKNLVFIVNPLTKRAWTVRNVKIINK